MEALTKWTTSLVSSAVHLKGLSQQEIFLLNKKEKSSSVHYIYITHMHTAGVSPPPTYHAIPPLSVCFCTSALQCSWVDFIISTAKSYIKDKEHKRKIHFSRSNLIWAHSVLAAKTVMDYNYLYKKCCLIHLLYLVLERYQYLVFELSIESKLVLRLSIRQLIFPKPVHSGL